VRRLAASLAFSALLLGATAARAQAVDVRLSGDTAQLLDALGLPDEQALETLLDAEVGALYGLVDVQEYLRLSANAQSLVTAGIGADYASNPDGFFFGFGVNAAVDAGDADPRDPNFDLDREVPVSAGAMLSLMAGYNLAELGLPWLTLSAHGMHFPMNVDQLEGDFTNVGARAQIKLFRQDPEGVDLLYWGGIDVTTGFSYARTTLTLAEGDYEAATDLGEGVRLETTSNGTLVLRQTAYVLPVEVTTNLTILEFVTLYGGAGVDIPFGDAGSELDLQTDLVGVIDDTRVDVGDATLRIDEAVDADDFLPRVMVGVQANVWLVRAFAQLSISTRDTAVGLSTGARVMF
jgi:hypothetical protein